MLVIAWNMMVCLIFFMLHLSTFLHFTHCQWDPVCTVLSNFFFRAIAVQDTEDVEAWGNLRPLFVCPIIVLCDGSISIMLFHGVWLSSRSMQLFVSHTNCLILHILMLCYLIVSPSVCVDHSHLWDGCMVTNSVDWHCRSIRGMGDELALNFTQVHSEELLKQRGEQQRLERDLEEASRRLTMAHREIRHLTDELDSLRKNEGYCGRSFSDVLVPSCKKKIGRKNASN